MHDEATVQLQRCGGTPSERDGYLMDPCAKCESAVAREANCNAIAGRVSHALTVNKTDFGSAP